MLVVAFDTVLVALTMTPAPASDPTPHEAPVRIRTGARSSLAIAGYVEAFYSYNLNRPSNGLTNFRAFDNRHNALTLQNLALDVNWVARRVYARIALQAGHTPATYYGNSEPTQVGSSGVAASDASVFRNVQQAYAGVHLLPRGALFIEAGIFLSPIGFESLAIRDNWHWSHSALFFTLPFYHSGLHVGTELRRRHRLVAALYNGWNNVVDNNPEKSLALAYDWNQGPRFKLEALYFTGVERPRGAPEGRAWRHLFEVSARGAPVSRLGLLSSLITGFEPNRLGTSWWFAGAAAARYRVFSWLFVALRGTFVRETRARSAAGIAGPITVPNTTDSPVQWLAGTTLTFDFRPVEDHIAFKLEYRHDEARSPLFFFGQVEGDGSAAAPFVPTARAQDTITLGLHAWF